jgi:hypothetical protein
MLRCPCFSPVGDSVEISKPMDALPSTLPSKEVLRRVFSVAYALRAIAHE